MDKTTEPLREPNRIDAKRVATKKPPPYHDIDLPAATPAASVVAPLPIESKTEVILVVYRWQNAQPGTLHWIFPSLEAALRAARALKNAVGWVVLKGREVLEVEAARGLGLVIAEAV